MPSQRSRARLRPAREQRVEPVLEQEHLEVAPRAIERIRPGERPATRRPARPRRAAPGTRPRSPTRAWSAIVAQARRRRRPSPAPPARSTDRSSAGRSGSGPAASASSGPRSGRCGELVERSARGGVGHSRPARRGAKRVAREPRLRGRATPGAPNRAITGASRNTTRCETEARSPWDRYQLGSTSTAAVGQIDPHRHRRSLVGWRGEHQRAVEASGARSRTSSPRAAPRVRRVRARSRAVPPREPGRRPTRPARSRRARPRPAHGRGPRSGPGRRGARPRSGARRRSARPIRPRGPPV